MKCSNVLKKIFFNKVFIMSFLIALIILGINYYVNNKDEIVEDKTLRKINKIRKKDRDIYNLYKFEKVSGTVKGIDVSSWQGDINFEKVKESGIDFIMIRCGFRNLTNADIVEDKKFKYNISEAIKYDIPVGVYFYSTARNELEAMEEASFVLNLIMDYKITYPVAYDFEMFDEKRTKGVSAERINKNAKAFLEYIEEHGYEGMMYSNLTAINDYWNISDFSEYELWFAHYVDKSSYEGEYGMWQYSDKGRVDGIVGNVDLNEAYFYYKESK